MYILGISAFYHDSAACLVRDGTVCFAAQEERFSRVKHDNGFPIQAISRALQSENISFEDLDHVSYYDKPLLTFDRLLETWLATAPRGLSNFMKGWPVWLKEKLFLSKEIDRGLGNRFQGPIHYLRHHQSHASSAFYPSPFEEAAILTLDGVGEWSTTTLGMGKHNRIDLLKEIQFPHSLGLLYSAFTYYLGFRVNSGEYKVMGLAPYGRPIYSDLIYRHLINVKPDGSFWMDMTYFNYCQGLTMTHPRFHELFGGAPRKQEDTLSQRHMDIAASIQKVCEEVMRLLAKHTKDLTGADYLCMAGGCALNCVANGLISRERIFKKIFVQPAAGDAGGALGAALFTWHQILGNARNISEPDGQHASLLGTSYSQPNVIELFQSMKLPFRIYDSTELPQQVAQLLIEGRVIGFFDGRMEFGPRALGGRSIIGDPRIATMQTTMNVKIKFRESFRPFAPSIMAEHATEYFDLSEESPYMLLVAPVQATHLKPIPSDMEETMGLEKLKMERSDIPAVTHVDGSARVQTVDATRFPRFHSILKAFYAATGCPVVINTSFNIRGEPIVESPQDAYRCFMYTDMDALVVEGCIFLKEEQPPLEGADEYKRHFKHQD